MAIRKIQFPSGDVVDINDERVVLTSPSDGQILVYDSSTGKIVNEDVPQTASVTIRDWTNSSN